MSHFYTMPYQPTHGEMAWQYECIRLGSIIGHLQMEVNMRDEHIDQLLKGDETVDNEEELASCKREITDLTETLATKDRELETCKAQLATKDRELETCKAQLATKDRELETCRAQLEGSVVELNTSFEDLKTTQAARIEQMCAANARQLETLKSSKNKLINEGRAEIKSLTQQLENASKELTELRKTGKGWMREKHRLESDAANLRKDVNIKIADLARMSVELAETRRELRLAKSVKLSDLQDSWSTMIAAQDIWLILAQRCADLIELLDKYEAASKEPLERSTFLRKGDMDRYLGLLIGLERARISMSLVGHEKIRGTAQQISDRVQKVCDNAREVLVRIPNEAFVRLSGRTDVSWVEEVPQ
jgi:predicted  nucleic acid-binding Zn-ribbon protein